MKNLLLLLYRKQSVIYKAFLYVTCVFLVIYLFPKGGQFKYNFQKGKPWQYENLYAPFNFTIKKSVATLEQEQQDIQDNAIPYFNYSETITETVKQRFQNAVQERFVDSLFYISESEVIAMGNTLIQDIYAKGYIDEAHSFQDDQIVFVKNGNEATQRVYSRFYTNSEVAELIKRSSSSSLAVQALLMESITPALRGNVFYDQRLTESSVKQAISEINPNKGVIEKDARIIARGEVVEGDTFQVLNSLKSEYQSQVWSQNNRYWLILGYALLVSLVFIMLFLFLKQYRPEIYHNNTKVSFIFFNIIIMVLITTLVVKYDNAKYIYIIPLCILPIILKSFFDARLGLFVHVLTILLLGFIVPNSFEFMFLQIIAGIVTILTVSELYKRANLFISVGQITFIYILGYFAFYVIQEGNVNQIEVNNFIFFVICGLVTLFAFPLIYIYEKIFGLVSEVSLLELSNTNSKLLKELSNKAPGTFHHSLNVANLAEAAANEIGANSMLVRVGALYHDIGKMINPTNFTENQVNMMNPLGDLEPKESAKSIIGHVIKGIEIARKNKIPDRVIDFIRTHHGTNLVYYFYKKEEELNGTANEADFTYPGPKPFSKETAILMMADSVEAATKSLKEPTASKIEDFVENIVNSQMKHGQFINANITFKEIETIKKVLKKKLNNIYHLRIEYPE